MLCDTEKKKHCKTHEAATWPFPPLYGLRKTCLARPREQRGSGVSDDVVSHGCECLDTHGLVQL